MRTNFNDNKTVNINLKDSNLEFIDAKVIRTQIWGEVREREVREKERCHSVSAIPNTLMSERQNGISDILHYRNYILV